MHRFGQHFYQTWWRTLFKWIIRSYRCCCKCFANRSSSLYPTLSVCQVQAVHLSMYRSMAKWNALTTVFKIKCAHSIVRIGQTCTGQTPSHAKMDLGIMSPRFVHVSVPSLYYISAILAKHLYDSFTNVTAVMAKSSVRHIQDQGPQTRGKKNADLNRRRASQS